MLVSVANPPCFAQSTTQQPRNQASAATTQPERNVKQCSEGSCEHYFMCYPPFPSVYGWLIVVCLLCAGEEWFKAFMKRAEFEELIQSLLVKHAEDLDRAENQRITGDALIDSFKAFLDEASAVCS